MKLKSAERLLSPCPNCGYDKPRIKKFHACEFSFRNRNIAIHREDDEWRIDCPACHIRTIKHTDIRALVHEWNCRNISLYKAG